MGPGGAGSRGSWAFACAVALFWLGGLPGCEPDGNASAPGRSASAPASSVPASGSIRMLEPPGEAVSMASLPTAELAGETRPVVSAPETRVVRWREDVLLGRSVSVQVSPSELTAQGEKVETDPSERVILMAWVSAPDPSHRGQAARELRLARGLRHRFEAEPLLVDVADPEPIRIEIAIPEPFHGLEGWLNVLARPLPRAGRAEHDFGPVELRRGDRLVFGYGVAEEGWLPGMPPVVFRVRVEREPNERQESGAARTDARPIFERRLDPAQDPRDRGFFDASVGLDALAGERVTFILEHQVLPLPGEGGADVSFPLFANPQLVPRAPARPPRRSLILISLDTLRARSVGAYGYARDTTPVLDARVARAGALVEQAIAPMPFTPPSHMTMLTGLEPCAHGVKSRHDALSPQHVTLAETLRAEGYRTAAFTENAYVVAGSGFARGFDVYVEQRDEETAAPGFAAETLAGAGQWLREPDPRPFFLFVHTYQVHDPYTPPRAFAELFAGDGLAPKVPPRHRRALDDYDREIRYTDELLAGFLDALDALGLAEKTLLVVTSDHGEGFGEHFWGGHGASPHDEAIRVPMLLRAPGLIPPGTRVTTPVAMADLAPTLLDLLEVDAPAPSMGRSFASLLTGHGPVFEERPIGISTLDVTQSGPLEGVRTSRSKYVRTLAADPDAAPAGRRFEALYDLVADPGERHNLVGEAPELLAEARAALEQANARCADFVATYPATAAGERAPARDPGWMIHRDDIDRKLRSLGYVE